MAFGCMTSAVSGLKAHQTAMDVVGNNISNVDTESFKSGSADFRDTMYQTMNAASGDNTAAGLAGINPSQIGYGSAASGVTVNTAKGGRNETGAPMDVYIDGSGYFAVVDGAVTAGSTSDTTILPSKAYTLKDPTTVKYTRVGHLSFDSNGFLTDGKNYILGKQYLGDGTGTTPTPADYTGTNKPGLIKYNGDVGKLQDVAIGGDGTITATYGGKPIKVGQIALSNFPNNAGLTMMGGSYYKSSDNSGTVQYADPNTGATGALVAGAVEGSNVDLATEFSNMIMFERGYQANTKMISVADEMYQTLVNMK